MYREPTLLLVEDDDLDAELITRGFRRQKIGNHMVRARDGVEALEMLRDPSAVPEPRMILLDINMPRMDGHEFLAELRKDEQLQTSVVFVLTTSDSDSDRYRSYQMNVAGYVVKNNAGEDFINLINMLDHYWKVVELPLNARPGSR